MQWTWKKIIVKKFQMRPSFPNSVLDVLPVGIIASGLLVLIENYYWITKRVWTCVFSSQLNGFSYAFYFSAYLW